MVTLSYDFYKNIYKGNLSEQDFEHELRKASKLVSNRTGCKVDDINDDNDDKDLIDDIKFCICSVIDRCNAFTLNGNKVIASQSSGKISETYAINDRHSSFEAEISDIVKLWLSCYGFTDCIWV